MDHIFSYERLSPQRSTLGKLTLMTTLLITSMVATASTWDEIAALEADKKPHPVSQQQQVQHDHEPFMLSDGRSVRVEDWKLVLFMQSSCSYCHQFDPVLNEISKQTGISVFPYTLDGRGDATFPAALPASPDVMVEFFSNGLPIATPTTFLVNVNTMTTYPLFQGAVDQAGFISRLDEVLQVALNQGAHHGQN